MALTAALVERFLTRQETGSAHYFEANEIVDLIHYFYETDDEAHLEEAVELAKTLHPDNIDIQVTLCQTLVWSEEYESALELLDTLHLQGDQDADMLRLECYLSLDKFDEALNFVDELTDTNCDYLDDAFVEIACTMNEKNELLEKAYQFIQKGIALFPENDSLHSELCLNLYVRGFHHEAMEMCRQLTLDFPDSTEIWYLLSELYYDCADYENAVTAIDYALSSAIAEDNNEVIYELTWTKARHLFKNQSYILAISTFRELTSCDEYDAVKVNPCMAECYMYLTNFRAAYDLLKAIYGQDEIEDKIAFYGNYIYCCIYTDRRNEAIDVLCEALKNYPYGILEYLASMNYKIRHQMDMEYIDEATLGGTGELVRDFLINTAYYN